MGAWIRDITLVRHDNAVTTAITLFLAMVISVIIHECGHLLPSLCLGFRVCRLVIGPLAIVRSQSKWRLEYSRKWFMASVSAVPAGEFAWRARMLFVVAAGPLASFYFFLYAMHQLVDFGPFTPSSEMWSSLAQLNFFIFVLGLVPNSASAGTRNDARLFLTLCKNGDEAQQIRLYHATTRLQAAGIRPREYPLALLNKLANTKGNPDLTLFNAHTLFLWALDRQDLAVADRWDKYTAELMDERSLRLSDTVLIESGCFDLLHRESPLNAVHKLSSANLKKVAPWLRPRAKAALFLANGSHAQAICAIAAARKCLSPEVPYHQFELALLDALESRAILLSSTIAGARIAA